MATQIKDHEHVCYLCGETWEAAEREKREGIENRLGVAFDRMVADYQQQLAAERERLSAFTLIYDETARQLTESRKQLSAEKQEASFDVMDVAKKAHRKIEELEKQLAADSLSGIARVLDDDETYSDSELGVTVIRSKALAAEREKVAQAEAQDWRHMEKAHKEVMLEREKVQPLVELLEETSRSCRNWDYGTGLPSHADKIDAALARFKEKQ